MNMHHKKKKKTAWQNSLLGETLNNNVMKYNNITGDSVRHLKIQYYKNFNFLSPEVCTKK